MFFCSVQCWQIFGFCFSGLDLNFEFFFFYMKFGVFFVWNLGFFECFLFFIQQVQLLCQDYLCFVDVLVFGCGEQLQGGDVVLVLLDFLVYFEQGVFGCVEGQFVGFGYQYMDWQLVGLGLIQYQLVEVGEWVVDVYYQEYFGQVCVVVQVGFQVVLLVLFQGDWYFCVVVVGQVYQVL